MVLVRCNKCGWIGKDEELGLYYRDDIEYCPKSKSTEALMDLEAGRSFDETEIEKLWELLGEVPVNDDDEIEEEFLGFLEGTHKEEVWHWFDEVYPAGVCRLMIGGK